MDVDVLGIDFGKNSCSVVGLDPRGRVVLLRRMRRAGAPRVRPKPICFAIVDRRSLYPGAVIA
jgi:hypothetical protein